jgi:acylphosphatase
LPPREGKAIFGCVIVSVQVFYEGNVQGVGFRWSVRQIAKGFDVTGLVRNLQDGRVELQATGGQEELRAFLEAILQSELRGHIRKHTETPLPDPPAFRGFEIGND